jgi:hypothetical protein
MRPGRNNQDVSVKVIIVEVRIWVPLRRLSHNERAKDAVCVMRHCKEIDVA